MITRRNFIATLTASLAAIKASAANGAKSKILLKSGWQTVNIGDVGHTPGVLRLLEEHLPEVEVCLWPNDIGDGVEKMLLKRFPKLKIVRGEEVKNAFAECDFLLHGSGPSLVAADAVAKWKTETSKPYGIYGITYAATDEKSVELLSGARFAFFRDSVSLQFAKDHGVKCPVMEFGPDGAFAVDLRNDQAADEFLGAHGLEKGKFLCCIPRLRYTPYWKIPSKHRTIDDKKHARNEEMKEHDHAPLREAIIAVLNETDMKILLCPEDMTQMEIGREMIYEKLPEPLKSRVIWREKFWLTDEALSTYVKSTGLFGLEMHSPIMCIGNGIPAIVCRFKEETSKGIMWRDIGLGDWLFDMDEPDDVKKIVPAVLALAKDPAAAKAMAAKGLENVHTRQRETLSVLKNQLS